MPRKSRDFYLSDFYHIMVQGDEKKDIFSKERYKDKYIYLLKHNAFRNDVRIIAYCIMDNHVHVLIHSKEQKRMIKMMMQCGTTYGMFYNKESKKVGHVFRDRYRSEAIYSREYLINCIKYIHENPVKAKMVKGCSNYLYSSFNEYLHKTKSFYSEMMEICDFDEEEYYDLIKNSHTEVQYIDDIEREEFDCVFNEIKSKYDMDNLNEKEIVEIYLELKERCKASKTQVAKLLNLKRTTFLEKLKRNDEKGRPC